MLINTEHCEKILSVSFVEIVNFWSFAKNSEISRQMGDPKTIPNELKFLVVLQLPIWKRFSEWEPNILKL
jgi:hypothetical protein